MTSISASIITLAGAILMAAGGFISHDQTSSGLMTTGIVVGSIGLLVWGKAIVRIANEPDRRIG